MENLISESQIKDKKKLSCQNFPEEIEYLRKLGYIINDVIDANEKKVILKGIMQKKEIIAKIIKVKHQDELIDIQRKIDRISQIKSQFIEETMKYYIQDDKKRIYIISQFQKCCNAWQYFSENKQLNEKQIANIARSALKGIQALMKKKYIHGGIKMSNVMITNDDTVFLVDSCISSKLQKEIKQPIEVEGLEHLDNSIFQSLEQQESGLILPETDIYAVGIILYILAGGDNDASIFENMRQGIYPEISFNKQFHRLLRIALTMIKKEPAQRSATDIAITKLSTFVYPLKQQILKIPIQLSNKSHSK